ncbi:hypothetical protein KJ557_00680 [Patescibacteria group bacterium]|nr:hypothetical protein [Patescibacteria group bacterium]
MILETTTKEVIHEIIQKFKPKKIIIFGSYAWGKPTAGVFSPHSVK